MFPLTPALSLKGEGGVRAGIILWGTLSPRGEGRGEGIKPHFTPKFDPLTLFSQKRLPRICSLLIMIIIVTLIVIYKHYVTYG